MIPLRAVISQDEIPVGFKGKIMTKIIEFNSAVNVAGSAVALTEDNIASLGALLQVGYPILHISCDTFLMII
jgi:hypothetical protein